MPRTLLAGLHGGRRGRRQRGRGLALVDRRVSWFALPGRAAEFELPHAAPLPDLLDSILAGGRVTLCTQCAARREITEKDVLAGVRIAGAQVFVQEATADGTQALVY